MKVICDSCNKEFIMKQEMLQEKYLGAMYTEVYFNCPKCNKKYLVCILNAKCRKLQRKIEEKSLQTFNKTKEVKSVLSNKSIDKVQDQLKKEMDRINGR